MSSTSSKPPIRRWDDSDSSSEDEGKFYKQKPVTRTNIAMNPTQLLSESKLCSYPIEDVSHYSYASQYNRDKNNHSLSSQYSGDSGRRQSKTHVNPPRKGDDLKSTRVPPPPPPPPPSHATRSSSSSSSSSWKDMAKQSQKFGMDAVLPTSIKYVDGSTWMAQRQMLQQQKESEAHKRKLEEEQEHANSLKMKHKHQFDALKTILEVNQHERQSREDLVSHPPLDVSSSTELVIHSPEERREPKTESRKLTSLQTRLGQMAIKNSKTMDTTIANVETTSNSIANTTPTPVILSKKNSNPIDIQYQQYPQQHQVEIQKKPFESTPKFMEGKIETTATTMNPPPPIVVKGHVSSSLQQSLLYTQNIEIIKANSHDTQPKRQQEKIYMSKTVPVHVVEPKEDTYDEDSNIRNMERDDVDRKPIPYAGKNSGRGRGNNSGDGRHAVNNRRDSTSSGRSSQHLSNPPQKTEHTQVSSSNTSTTTTTTVAATTTPITRHTIIIPQPPKLSSSTTKENIQDSTVMYTYSIDLDDYLSPPKVDGMKIEPSSIPHKSHHKPRHSTQGELQADGTVHLTKVPVNNTTSYKKGNTSTKTTVQSIVAGDVDADFGEKKSSLERNIVSKDKKVDIHESIKANKDDEKERVGSSHHHHYHHGKSKGVRRGSNT